MSNSEPNPAVKKLKDMDNFALFAFFPGLVFSGYVLTVLWDWFLVPLDVPQIGLAHAIGVRVLISSFKGSQRTPAQIADEVRGVNAAEQAANLPGYTWTSVKYIYTDALGALLAGWSLTWFM